MRCPNGTRRRNGRALVVPHLRENLDDLLAMSDRYDEAWLANRNAKRAGPNGTALAQNASPAHQPGKSYRFIVWGVAQPAGSKQAFVPLHPHTKQPYRNANGGIVVSVVDDNKRSKGWKRLVAKTAQEECGTPLLPGPLKVTLAFYRERPKSHCGAVGLNKVGRETPYPITKPDSGKLARGTIDAMTGIMYGDDAQIVDDITLKRYGLPARVEITIEQIEVSDPGEQPVLFEELPPWEQEQQ
jgi:Holliday junction resolvase RusA-like endonuclease